MPPPGASAPDPRSRGLFASLKRLGSTLAAVFHSRVELLAHEFERERIRVTRLLLLGIAAYFFLSLGALTATMFVIVLFWDSQRLVAIGFLTLVYLSIGGALVLIAKRDSGRAARPFSSTLEQLKKDRDELKHH